MNGSPCITVKIFSTLQLKLGMKLVRYPKPPLEILDFEKDIHDHQAQPSAPTVLEILSWLQEIVDRNKRDAEVDIVHELLDENGSIRPGTLLLIDGKNVLHAEGVRTQVPYGSDLSLFPPSGGG
jgi:sulfur-carrier protein